CFAARYFTKAKQALPICAYNSLRTPESRITARSVSTRSINWFIRTHILVGCRLCLVLATEARTTARPGISDRQYLCHHQTRWCPTLSCRRHQQPIPSSLLVTRFEASSIRARKLRSRSLENGRMCKVVLSV